MRVRKLRGALIVRIIDADQRDARVFRVFARMDAPERARAQNPRPKLHSPILIPPGVVGYRLPLGPQSLPRGFLAREAHEAVI